ncbi:MAG: 50S ribosomal protein L30 [Saprospiraceae bacterium]|nr:50S ribosomal protein L30 [Saprospiraceae bacterium]MBK8484596.1 50S ribosomal protein L30 [Saprospiraceae bacterium]MBK9222023.1 50S ribosomal protein L30 [Saprospiraceae bacterium]MBK9721067.1 50S ribosomal protein L30 [Saprospiraceae bacterium]MBK9728058.1 50S ribosomal protein L30 [Saprospiraceae bacterium]
MSKIKITQSKSVIKASIRQKLTIQALGLRNPHDSVELESTPQILGMVNKVRHLVEVEKI